LRDAFRGKRSEDCLKRNSDFSRASRHRFPHNNFFSLFGPWRDSGMAVGRVVGSHLGRAADLRIPVVEGTDACEREGMGRRDGVRRRERAQAKACQSKTIATSRFITRGGGAPEEIQKARAPQAQPIAAVHAQRSSLRRHLPAHDVPPLSPKVPRDHCDGGTTPQLACKTIQRLHWEKHDVVTLCNRPTRKSRTLESSTTAREGAAATSDVDARDATAEVFVPRRACVAAGRTAGAKAAA